MDASLRALNRFGLGARIGERASLGDSHGWLRSQLTGPPPLIPAPSGASARDISAAIEGFRNAGQGDQTARQEARRRLRDVGVAEAGAGIGARLNSERPFVERLVAFWSNHLCVSTQGEVLVVPLAGSYERDVIRPHVLGRFADMVLASARHPAMLVYLDNFQSIGPRSQGATFVNRRGNGARGLNENYARELLELHTLGVDGGYAQEDIQELARILTGWTVNGLVRGPGAGRMGRANARTTAQQDGIGFGFQDVLHEPGDKTLLGVRYREAGVAEGERAIGALCQHPSTAAFVARKLVTHFVADDPPPAAVDRVARAFRESDGDLRVVSEALIELPEAWDEQHVKFRTPQDYFVAILRALQVPTVDARTLAVLDQLRHPLWSPLSPKGFSDAMADWADPDSLLNRAELARDDQSSRRRTTRSAFAPRSD